MCMQGYIYMLQKARMIRRGHVIVNLAPGASTRIFANPFTIKDGKKVMTIVSIWTQQKTPGISPGVYVV